MPASSPIRVLLPCLLPGTLAFLLAGCGDRYSPDTYATRAVQQANKVEQGVVAGVRKVQIKAEGSTGAAAGAAAGGVIGAQTPGGGIGAALGGVGGALVGGLIGKATESAAVDTPAFEYVVRTDKADLLSVTQTDTVPLALGQKVLVITGTQARVVTDYTVPAGPPPTAEPKPAADARSSEPPGAEPSATEEIVRRLVPAPPPAPTLVPAPPRPDAGLPAGVAPIAAAIVRD